MGEKLLPKRNNGVVLVVCAMIAEMDLAVNNLINLFFISRWLGDDGAAAYEIVMPCLMLTSAFMVLGINGMQAVCAKDYGANDRESFERHKNAGYSWTIVIMGLLVLVYAVFRAPILDLLGANDGSAELARLSGECFIAFLPCFILQAIFGLTSCLLYLEERRKLVIVNIVLYVCLIAGNVIVTVTGPTMTRYIAVNFISEAVADLYLLVFCLARKKGSISAFTSFRLRFSDVKEVFFTGLPDFMEYAFVAILYLAENVYMLSRFNESLLAGLTVFEAIENIPETICVGFCFLVTATLGTRVGRILAAVSDEEAEKANDALLHSAKRLTRGALIGAFAVALILLFSAKPMIGLFFRAEASDPMAMNSAVLMIVSYAIGFVFYILNSELVCYYKIVEAYSYAHFVFLAEALVFPLGAKILFGELFGVTGFCLGGAFAEALTFCLNIGFVWMTEKRFPRRLADFRMNRYMEKLKNRGRI